MASNPLMTTVSIDGKDAASVAAPSTEADCLSLIGEARESGYGLVPLGGGVSLAQGNPLSCREWVAASMANLAGIIDYSPDDMVVTAGAGTTLSDLQTELGRHRQFVALDCPFPDRATLGGIVATNGHGLWRPAYGVPRDRLLGVRVAMADGSVVRGGGKVVKNVAGYDLCKLFAGSWGTLGLITEVTFKTNPAPPKREHLWFEAAGIDQAISAALAVHTARLEPVYLVVHISTGAASVAVGLHGGEESVGWQARAIGDSLQAAGLRSAEPVLDEDQLRHAISGAPSPVKVRITVRPSDFAVMAGAVAHMAESLVCHIQTGIMEAAIQSDSGDSSGFDRTRRSVESLVAGRGYAAWTEVPAEFKRGMDVWGKPRADWTLMRKMKQALDPHRLFSPGRFVGGI